MGHLQTIGASMAIAAMLTVGQVTFAQSADEEGGTEGTSAQRADLPSVGEVVDRLDDLYRSDSSHATMTMTVEKPRGTRELTMESWSKGDEQMLVVIRKPAREAGTATLRTEEGLWNYLPRADRMMRIPSGLLSDSWMGSHFSNDDLMRETSYEEDYSGEVEVGKLEGREVLKLTLTPREDAPVVYSKLVFYVTRDDWVPLETEYYDDGEVVRTMEYSNVETIGGKKLPTTMTLTPADADDEMTRVSYEDLEFGVDLDDGLFSKRGLRRRAR